MMAAPLLGRLLSPLLAPRRPPLANSIELVLLPPFCFAQPLPLVSSIELVLLPPFCSAAPSPFSPLSPCQLHRTCPATVLLFRSPSPPFPLPAPPNLSCYRPSVPQSFSPLPLASSTELVLLPSFCSAVPLPFLRPSPCQLHRTCSATALLFRRPPLFPSFLSPLSSSPLPSPPPLLSPPMGWWVLVGGVLGIYAPLLRSIR